MAATEYLKNGVAQRHVDEIAEYYGTVLRSVYTCWKSMTGGQSWGEVMDPLVDVGLAYVLIFLFYIAFSILALLNIVTGVFVDGAMAKSANDRELVVEKELAQKKTQIANLHELFAESDLDGNGSITYEEFAHQMEDERFRAYMDSLKIDTSNIFHLFQQLDRDGGGSISSDEFVDSLLHLMRAQSVDQAVHACRDETRALRKGMSKVTHRVNAIHEHIVRNLSRQQRLHDLMMKQLQPRALEPPTFGFNQAILNDLGLPQTLTSSESPAIQPAQIATSLRNSSGGLKL